MKNKKIKIKHRKYSLYQRKRSKSRKVLTVLLMVVLVAGLCVLGYGLGRPLVNYFQNRGNESQTSSAWTPPSSAEINSSDEGTSDRSTAEATKEPTQEAQEQKTVSAFILPDSALASSDALNSALAAAKNGNYTDITVTLKDDNGNFLYKTGIDGIPETQVTGTLTAKQIADIIAKAGFTPRARINTLLDRTSQTFGGESVCYMIADGGIWHDYYVDQGGKSWLDPFEDATAKYLSAITSEVSGAGFKSIILANTKYPAFNPQDYTNFLRQLNISDDNARLEALWKIADACIAAAKPSGAEISIEVNSGDLLADEKALTSAEITGNKAKLRNTVLLIDYSPEDSANYASTKAFIGKLSVMYSGQTIAVRLQTSGFSADALADVRKAFTDSGITVLSE